jgi:hypothetical protein
MAANVFGLTWAELHCDEHTTLDDFGMGILVKEEGDDYFAKESTQVKSKGEVLRPQAIGRPPLTRITVSIHLRVTGAGRQKDIQVSTSI